MPQMQFISPSRPIACPRMWRDFPAEVGMRASLTVTGLGLYRAFLNGKRVGADYLTPGFNDYDAYVTCQTYDVSALLQAENRLEVWLGDGWYKGRFGTDGGQESIWGKEYCLAISLTAEGQIILSTDESWLCSASPIVGGNIYDGEARDDTRLYDDVVPCKIAQSHFQVEPEIAPPVRVVDRLLPELIISPKGEMILDFGQNMAGVVRFTNRLPCGEKISMHYGEVLQEGCFYRDNLRSAQAAYAYTSDGVVKEIEPLFTFYGFRYVLIEGPQSIDPADFTALALCCDLKETLRCKTSLPKLNRLMQNALWGQRSNFLYVPTDCPQRDERLGWTADAQVFAATACYHMDSRDFYRKFIKDMRIDQQRYYGGDVPMYTPSLKGLAGPGGAVWADAAVIIPWKVYQFYGDTEKLREAFPLMRDYVRTLMDADTRLGGSHLAFDGFTFGDWLALDGSTPTSLKGGTEDAFIQGVYYYNSVLLTGKAAQALGLSAEAEEYARLAQRIHLALLDEYITPNGNLSVDTQTGYVLSLHYGILRDKEKVVAGFEKRLKKDLYRIRTGFTGTPLLLPALFDNGMADMAYRMLLREDFPGWLYTVNLGATTIWERWNSLNADGSISGTSMNSLNHYAYGAVCEAIYSHMAGLSCATPGWTKARMAPQPNWRMKHIALAYDSASGRYAISWQIEEDGRLSIKATVPDGAQAHICLPNHPDRLEVDVEEGTYSFAYQPTVDYRHPFDANSLLCDLLASPQAAEILQTRLPALYAYVTGVNIEFQASSPFAAACQMPFLSADDVLQAEPLLKAVKV